MTGSGKWKRRRQKEVLHFPCTVVLLQKVHETDTQFVDAIRWVNMVGRGRMDFLHETKESHKWVFI